MKVPGEPGFRPGEWWPPIGPRALAVGFVLCWTACNASDDMPPPDGRNYRVVASLTIDPPEGASLPESFVLYLHASVSTARLVLWSGERTAAPPVAVTGQTLTTTAPLSLDVPGWPTTLRIDLASLSVEAKRNGVHGSFEGVAHLGVAGPPGTPEPAPPIWVTGSLTGWPDDGLPFLMGPLPWARLHPLDPITVRASSPLAPDVALDLVAADGERVLLDSAPPPELTGPGLPDPGLVDRFQSTSVLRFAQRYHLEARTPIRDLTGRVAAPTPLSIETIAEPDVLVDGGFEGKASGVYEGVWVGEWPPAISGLRSLAIRAWGGRFTARMKIPAGATRLRFAWRARTWAEGIPAPVVGTSVSIAWPGAGPAPTMLPPIDGGAIDQYTRASPVEVVVIPLPPEAPEEVWVVIEQVAPADVTPSDADIQFDDLVLE